MLVLCRKPGQKVRIGAGVCITVLQLRGKSCVRLGIDAPAEVPVFREELCAPVPLPIALSNKIQAQEPCDAARSA